MLILTDRSLTEQWKNAVFKHLMRGVEFVGKELCTGYNPREKIILMIVNDPLVSIMIPEGILYLHNDTRKYFVFTMMPEGIFRIFTLKGAVSHVF